MNGFVIEVDWGSKMLVRSEFKLQAMLVNSHLKRVADNDFKPFAAMAAAALKLAMLDAEAEVEADPDSLGPDQSALLYPPEDHEVDMIDLYCQSLGIDTQLLRDSSSSCLDQIADRVRAERAATETAQVISIDQARQRREAAAAARDAFFFSVPVLSRGRSGRVIGHQLAFAL